MPAVQEIKLDDLDAVKAIVEAVKDLAPRDQQRVFRWAAEKLGLPASRGEVDEPAAEADGPASSVLPQPEGSPQNAGDLRAFVAAKAPKSDVQIAVTVAYFLQFLAPGGDRRDAISAADLRDGCRKARVKQPKGARR
ncbi:MAG: hypothetical protein ACRD13_07585, partial [Terriglobales bacterium]